MGRPVEVDVTANDKTSKGLSDAERSFKRSQARIRAEQDKANDALGRGILGSINAVAPKFAQTLQRTYAAAGQAAGPLLAAGALAALPAISATLSGAIVGGVTGGGIIGGVYLATRDARVQAAGKTLGAKLLSGLESRAGVFVQPVLKSIDLIDRRFDQSGNTIRNIFGNTARFVVPLTDAITDAAQSTLEGVETVTARSSRVMDSFANGIRGSGESLKGFLENVSENGAESARAIDSAFSTLNGTLATTGEVVSGVTKILGTVDKYVPLSWVDTYKKGLEQIDEGHRKTGSGTFEVAAGFEHAAAETQSYAEKLAEADAKAEALAGANRSLYGATTDVAGALAAANESLKDNGKTLSTNSEKGRENRDALVQVAEAMNRQMEATIAANGAGVEAKKVAEGNREAFIGLATKAGLSAKAASDLANKLLGIPNVVRDVTIQGEAQAKAVAARITATLNAIKDENVNVNYQVNGVNSSRLRANAAKNFDAGDYWRATDGGGGRVRAGGPSRVEVDSTVQVMLDGQPFRDYTSRQVADSERRTALRAKVGKR